MEYLPLKPPPPCHPPYKHNLALAERQPYKPKPEGGLGWNKNECMSCYHINPEDSNFCNQCGGKL